MSAVLWALIAMLAYSFVAPFVSRAIGGGMPEFLVLLITSVMLVLASLLVAALTGELEGARVSAPVRLECVPWQARSWQWASSPTTAPYRSAR